VTEEDKWQAMAIVAILALLILIGGGIFYRLFDDVGTIIESLSSIL